MSETHPSDLLFTFDVPISDDGDEFNGCDRSFWSLVLVARFGRSFWGLVLPVIFRSLCSLVSLVGLVRSFSSLVVVCSFFSFFFSFRFSVSYARSFC